MLVLPSIIACEPLNILNLPMMGASGLRWSLSLKFAPVSFGSHNLQDSPSGQYHVPKHTGRPSLLLRMSPGAAIDSPFSLKLGNHVSDFRQYQFFHSELNRAARAGKGNQYFTARGPGSRPTHDGRRADIEIA